MGDIIKGLGLPYLGSKRRLAPKILDFIIKENPKAKHFVDLFGGGGAMSFHALQLPQFETVVYNELNTGVVALLKDIKDNGLQERHYQFIDRDTFHRHKNDDDWFGGLCKVVWSFGNNQKDYMYARTVEYDKYLIHKIIVDLDYKALLEFNKMTGRDFTLPGTSLCINDRKLQFLKQVKDFNRNHTSRQEHLERLKNLQHINQISQLGNSSESNLIDKLTLSNKSYLDVEIATDPNDTIIYLDPPYKGTRQYQLEIDYDELFEYVKDMTQQGYKVYVSSYECDRLKEVWNTEFSQRIAAKAPSKTIEKLFVFEE